MKATFVIQLCNRTILFGEKYDARKYTYWHHYHNPEIITTNTIYDDYGYSTKRYYEHYEHG